MLEPRAWVDVPSGDQYDPSYAGYKFHGIKFLPQGKHDLYTLLDLLAALREVTPEMMLAGTNAMDYARLAPEANRIVVADICFKAMLSAFERQMEGEK